MSEGTNPPLPAGDSLDSSILQTLMETLPDRIYFKDKYSRFVRNNVAHARSLGAASPADVVGKSDADFFSREHAERAFADEQVIIHTGRSIINKVEHTTLRDGTQAWVSTTKLPWRDSTGRIIGTFGLSRDITATKVAEEKLLEERNLLRTIIDHLPSRIFVKDAAARYVLNNEAHLKQLGVTHQEDARGKTTAEFFSGARGEQAMADDRQVLGGGPSILGQEKSDFAEGGNTHWSLTTKVPLHDMRGKLIGLVGISHDITRRKQMEQELQRHSIEMETDLHMARQVQEVFFSRAYPVFPLNVPPEKSALRFAHHYLPAASLGGDFFDIVRLSDTRCGILVCDVMGHGARAGLLTALIRGLVEEIGPRVQDPSHVLGEINRGLLPIVQQTGQPVFATGFFGVIDVAAGTLTYGNAGHPPPIVLRSATNTVEQLALKNPEPAAGLVENFEYTQYQCEFRPGDKLLGYTDGLFEAINSSGAMFGEEKLRALIQQSTTLDCAQLVERIVKDVVAFTGRSNFDDDVCLIAVEAVKAK